MQSRLVLTAIATIAMSMTAVAQDADIVASLKACADVTEQDARLACYDKLGERVLGQETAVVPAAPQEVVQPQQEAQPEVVAEAAPRVEPLPDDLGRDENVQYRGVISSCKKGHYGDWYFYFENGQIWKEVSNRSARLRECEFPATITRDTFGYKMRIDGIDKTLRVKRQK